MNPAPDNTAGSGGSFDPREAAALLDQTRRQARRQFEPAQPWLLAIRAVLVLAALGAVWLTVRGQHPYTGPGGSALLIVVAFVVINFTATVAVRRRATAGVSGKSRFSPAEITILAIMEVRADWRECGTGLAIAVTGAVGASAGQSGAWAVTGIGLCLTLLGSAAVIAWQLHRA